MTKWYVTDVDRTDVQTFDSYSKASRYVKGTHGTTTIKRLDSGIYEASVTIGDINRGLGTVRSIFIIREDKLSQVGFSDLNKNQKVERYHCPNCNSKYTLWPEFKGRRKLYKCEVCGETYWPSELEMYWGKSNKPQLTILKE